MMRALVFLALLYCSLVVTAAPYYEGIGCDKEGRNCVFGTPTHRVLEWKVRGSRLELGPECQNFYRRLSEGLQKIEMANDLNGNFTFEKFTATTLVDPMTKKPHGFQCEIEIHSAREDVLIKQAQTPLRSWIFTDMEKEAQDNCYSAHTDAQKEKCNLDLKAVCQEDVAKVEADSLSTYPQPGLSSSLLQGDICFVRHIRLELKKPAETPAE
ncbi:MAG: hypothetical protein KDD43_14580, partial [Bdellovibrionales bacterium]|nr:hypothetical protein [Bdellovibrionales bacterium]